MSIIPSDTNDLKNYFNEREFVEATINQINKDLLGLYYGNDLVMIQSDQPILEGIIEQLRPILKELSKRQPQQLSQLIYKVDLKEKLFIDSLIADPEFHNLAFEIIKREAQKVYLRQKFR